MSQFSVSVTKTKREFAGNGYTTIARFKLKPLEGGPTLVYEGNAMGGDFVDKCERLKRQPITVDVSEVPLHNEEDWKERIVRLALAQTIV